MYQVILPITTRLYIIVIYIIFYYYYYIIIYYYTYYNINLVSGRAVSSNYKIKIYLINNIQKNKKLLKYYGALQLHTCHKVKY